MTFNIDKIIEIIEDYETAINISKLVTPDNTSRDIYLKGCLESAKTIKESIINEHRQDSKRVSEGVV